MNVPAGWKLVPVEPTREMEIAGYNVPMSIAPEDIYRAMLAAAPSAPAPDLMGQGQPLPSLSGGASAGEREAFEAWWPTLNVNFVDEDLARDDEGEYVSPFTFCGWKAWQARAATRATTLSDEGKALEVSDAAPNATREKE